MRYPLEKYKYFVAHKEDGAPYKVIATSTYGGRSVKGISKCDPRDSFSIEKGKKLAAARCNFKVAQKRIKNAEAAFAKASEEYIKAMNRLSEMQKFVSDAYAEYATAREFLYETLDEER